MTEQEIISLVKQLDTDNGLEQETAWEKLRLLGKAVVPFMVRAYLSFKKWQGRAALVYHCTKYARENEEAFQLGIAASADRSTIVRYRACGLLAYSLQPEAVAVLEPLLDHRDNKTAEDAAAAIDAIKHQNHHYFIDRHHTGQTFWSVADDGSDVPL